MLALFAGLLWGVVAYLLGRVVFGPSIWPGVLGAPLVAIVVGHVTQDAFSRGSFLSRSLWSLVSLYLGALLFALPISIWQLIARGATSTTALEIAFEPLMVVVWGITMTGYFIALWPLSYFTHWFVDWRMNPW